MAYKKKLLEYRKLIGTATSSTNMRTVTFRDPASSLKESDNELNFARLNLQAQQSVPHHKLLNFEEDDDVDENRWSAKREYRNSIGATTSSSTMRTVSFQNSALNLDAPDNNSNTPQLNVQSQQRQQHCKLVNVEEDNFFCEDRRSAARESSTSKVPSPQPQKHQSVLPTPGYLREHSFLLEPIGQYVNWNSHHAFLASQPWCCIGDLTAFCDKYEFKPISISDPQAHANIVSEVRSLLSGKAPFDMRRRFPGSIRNMENLFVCIGRCPSIEYHLERILTAFRRPLNKLSTEKQNIAKQNFHLAVRELRLDISARISEIKLYDRNVFEKEFHLKWQNNLE